MTSTPREFQIATAPNRFSKAWKNRPVTWAKFTERIAALSVSADKDQGGYVAGYLRDGRRGKGTAETRSMLTLDVDFPDADFDLMLDVVLGGHAYALHETHSSTPEAPRYRLIVPLADDLTADEYVPAALKLMEQIGLDAFDPTTAQAERLMYWPVRKLGASYEWRAAPGELLDAQTLLDEYPDWRDASCWPDVAHTYRTGDLKKAGDPRERAGLVGAFNRAYTVTEAIETFLSGVYEPAPGGRWTFIGGHTVGGLAVYDEDTYAYSNHGTDPAEGRLLSAFDLVRVHLFGALDADSKPDTPLPSLPSQHAMLERIRQDRAVKLAMDDGRQLAAVIDFATGEPVEAEDDDQEDDPREWRAGLERDRRGIILPSSGNLGLIFANDPALAGKLGVNRFAYRTEVRGRLPWLEDSSGRRWTDADDAQVRIYVENEYGISAVGKVADALLAAAETNAFHPVREYLAPLVWDGTARVDTLLVDYLGADDNPYVRTVTRKALVGAVARVMRPGVKFDTMIVTTGPQGIGKSTLPARLAGEWFTDSLDDMHGKDAYEQISGKWIVEVGELAATRKSDMEAVKSFLSKTGDNYRAAYARHTMEQPRQCIFWGTSNDHDFLRDPTGNRRFWPVAVKGGTARKPWHLTDGDVAQVWAEAVALYEAGESLALNDEEDALASAAQARHTEHGHTAGMLAEFLEVGILGDWYKLGIDDRRAYIRDILGDGGGVPPTAMPRDRISAAEVWVEMFGGQLGQIHPAKASEIRAALDSMPGWSRHTEGSRKLRFGTGYGVQFAWVRDADPLG